VDMRTCTHVEPALRMVSCHAHSSIPVWLCHPSFWPVRALQM
jgi:hypothetical protein